MENNKRIILNNYINEKQIEHSENSNGILLNLSTLSDDNIDFLFSLYNMETNYKPSKYEVTDIVTVTPKPENEKTINYPDYELCATEKLMLSYSF